MFNKNLAQTGTILTLAGLFGLHCLSAPLGSQARIRSSFTEMLVNRQQVSHILFEERYHQPSITLIVHHAGIWGWQARSHALYKTCPDYAACLNELKKLDGHLKSGANIRLILNGSQITAWDL